MLAPNPIEAIHQVLDSIPKDVEAEADGANYVTPRMAFSIISFASIKLLAQSVGRWEQSTDPEFHDAGFIRPRKPVKYDHSKPASFAGEVEGAS